MRPTGLAPPRERLSTPVPEYDGFEKLIQRVICGIQPAWACEKGV